MTKYLLRRSHYRGVRVFSVICNITPFSGVTPTSHIWPQLPVVQHTCSLFFQPSHHIHHLHSSYTSQLKGLHISESPFQLYDLCLDVLTLLSEDSEAVNLRCYRFVP